MDLGPAFILRWYNTFALTARIFLKLLGATLCVLLVALLAADILASKVSEGSHHETLVEQVSNQCETVCALMAQPGWRPESLRHLSNSGLRLTRVQQDGRVSFDTGADTTRMENHASRPEFAAALRGSRGSDKRRSETTRTEYLYVAVPCPPGAVRLALPWNGVIAQIESTRRNMLGSIVLAFFSALLAAAFFAHSVSGKLGGIIDLASKLAEGRYGSRIASPGAGELGQLERRLNDTAEKLEKTSAELHRDHEELLRQEQIRKDFIMNVSHELRTPLASIQGYTETLLGGALYDNTYNLRFLEIIRLNTDRLTSLAGDLLTLTHLEQKAHKFRFATRHVNTVLLDCADSFRLIASRRGIAIHLEAAPDNAHVRADELAVHQALGNLLDNAVKYSNEGGTIYAGARPLPGGQFIEFYVRDNGIGIPHEDQSRLFERFYRVDKARSRELGGTGLGLAIVKHLIKGHGGETGVDSEPGRGSTFKFTLPVTAQPATSAPGVQNEFIES